MSTREMAGFSRRALTIALACLAVAIEIYYTRCDSTCSYLTGSIFNLPLEHIGIAFMAGIVLLSILKRDVLLFAAISAGVGAELYLIGFQVWHDTYCAYCLAFAAVILTLYALNFVKGRKAVSAASMAAALIFFTIFFEGSAFPVFYY